MTDADATSTLGAAWAASRDSTGGDRPVRENQAVVTAHRSAPGRTVFTAADNTDAWIASSLTLELTE